MRFHKHTEPRFSETIYGTLVKGYDDALTELLSDYPEYEIEYMQIIREEKKTIMKDLGYDSEDVPVEVPYIYVTVIMKKRKIK